MYNNYIGCGYCKVFWFYLPKDNQLTTAEDHFNTEAHKQNVEKTYKAQAQIAEIIKQVMQNYV